MDFIRAIFTLNQPIIQFAYGLSFFTMGLVIALQSRRSSRLELARSLAWLAAFGIAHGLYEWGELYSPVHEAYLSSRGILILHGIHLIVLSISFACLLEFGFALLRPVWRILWLDWVILGALGLYWAVIFVLLPQIYPDAILWHNTSEALSRIGLGFPGGLLAAYGLREQTYRYIAPLKAPHIVTTLRTAGIALAFYAVFGGLIPPQAPFFPANVLNDANFELAFGLPPLVFQSIIGIVLAFTMIRALEIFDFETEKRIEMMEQQQILAAERERIGRELHDGTIQTVYTAALLADSARKLVDSDSPIAGRLDKVKSVLNDAIQDLRRSLVDLHEAPAEEKLASALKDIAEDPRYRSLVNISLVVDAPDLDSLSPLRTGHVLAIVKEALSNVIRHAHARQVRIQAQQQDGRLALTVQDDGIGFASSNERGYGLRNMQDRARLLGGQIQIRGENGKGTVIQLTIPLKDER